MQKFNELIECSEEYRPQGQDVETTDLERSVLTGLLDPTIRVKYLFLLDIWDFSTSKGAGVLRLIKDLDSEGISVDKLTLDERKGDLDLDLSDYFLSISPSAEDIQGYIKLLREKGKKRVFQRKLLELQKRLEGADSGDLGTLLGELQKSVYDLDLSKKLGVDLKSETHYRKDFYDLLIKRGSRELIGLNTGFKNMNYLLSGLQNGLVVIAGVTGTGKTTFSNQLSNQVVASNTEVFCLYCSLEMSREDLEFMTYSRLSGIGLSDLKKGFKDDKGLKEKIGKVNHADEVYGSYCDRLYILDRRVCPTPTVDSIRGDYNRVRVESGLEKGLIVIDYLQIFDLTKEDRRLTIDRTLTDLKNLSIELSCPIVLVSSVSRASYEGGKGKIGLDVFKESGNIEFSADVAITMTAPLEGEAKLGLVEGGRLDEMWLSGVKNRWGSKGKMILFEFDPTCASFKEKIDKGGVVLNIPR